MLCVLQRGGGRLPIRRRYRLRQCSTAAISGDESRRVVRHTFGAHQIDIAMPTAAVKPGVTGEAPKHDTTGMQIWPNALRICEYLSLSVNSPKWRLTVPPNEFLTAWPSTKVLELGCGSCAAGGILAAKLGAESVHFTDGNPVVLKNAAENVHLNCDGAAVFVDLLQWGDQDSIDRLQNTLSQVDLVIGSDLLYAETTHAALLATVSAFAGANTKVLLAYRPRYPAERGRFVSAAEPMGFEVQHLAMYGNTGASWEHIEMLTLSWQGPLPKISENFSTR